jgi:hypothetical protein
MKEREKAMGDALGVASAEQNELQTDEDEIAITVSKYSSPQR